MVEEPNINLSLMLLSVCEPLPYPDHLSFGKAEFGVFPRHLRRSTLGSDSKARGFVKLGAVSRTAQGRIKGSMGDWELVGGQYRDEVGSDG
jgi:hypothetical protein